MERSQKDAGTIAALMIRLKEYRLPRAQRMLEKVSAGEKLADSDIEFLKRVLAEGKSQRSLIERHPEFQSLASRFVDLYTDIITRALENEKAG